MLKSGGAYALTTDIALAPETLAVRGNYAFALDHLLWLFREAGLAPADAIDMRLTKISANEPHDSAGVLHFGTAACGRNRRCCASSRVASRRRCASSCSPARPNVVKPKVEGLNRSIAWAETALAVRTSHRYQAWVRLNPYCFLPGARSDTLDLHGKAANAKADGSLAFCTHYVAYGTAQVEWRVTLATTEFESRGNISVGINEFRRKDAELRSVCQQLVQVPAGSGRVIQLRFDTPVRAGHAYVLFGTKAAGHLALGSVDVMVRRTPA